MVTITGPFEGGDPSAAPARTFTVGRATAAELQADVLDWTARQVERAIRGDAEPDEDEEPTPAVGIEDVPVGLWSDLEGLTGCP
jgi:hypothetical protein